MEASRSKTIPLEDPTMTTELTHWIDGQHVKGTSGRFADVYNPPVEFKEICVRTRKWRMCVLTYEYKVESVTYDQHDGV